MNSTENISPSVTKNSTTVPPSVPRANPSHHDTVPLVPDNFLLISASRSDERLANLDLEDKLVLVEWLRAGIPYRKIIELAAQPRPEGLDLKISLGSLSRFNQKTRLAERIADAAQMVQQISPDAKDSQAALEILAETHALHAMAAPDLDHAAFQQLARYLQRQQEYKLRQRALDLREKRAAFDMQHKHFDLFKRTMEILPELNQTLADQSLTPRERVQKHLDKIFGRECRDMINRANQKWAEQHPEAQHTEPQVEEKDIVPPASKEWDQPAVTRAVKIALGPGFENLFDDSTPSTNTKPD